MAQSDIKAETLVSDLNAGKCKVSASGDVGNTVLLDDKVEERSRHNAQQPLFRLSPEILATILGFLRDISPINMSVMWWSHQPTPEAAVLHRLGWVVTTHVCRRLRNVALDYSELWSTIQYTGIATSFTRECLQRSRNATINVIVSELWDDEPGAQFLNLFRSSHVVSRIQSLKIDTLLSSFLETILPYPWPRLESLEMDCDNVSYDRTVLTLPLRGADSKAPRLRDLTISGLYISWNNVLSPTLTNLCLTRHNSPWNSDVPSVNAHRSYPTDIRSGCSADMLVECLPSLTLLRSLVLQNVLPVPLSASKTSSISLPSLKSLEISDIAKRCTWLLELLDMPRLEEVKVVTALDSADIPERVAFSRGIARLMSCISDHMASPIHAAQIEMLEDQLHLDVWPRNAVSCPPSYNHPKNYTFNRSDSLSITLHLPRVQQQLHCSIMKMVLEAVSFPKLEVFGVSADIDPSEFTTFMDYNGWRRIYEYFSRAKSVVVEGDAIVTLLPLLASHNVPNWMFPNFPQPREPLFLELEGLVISLSDDADVGRSSMDRCLKEEPEDHGPLDEYLVFYRRCLASRAGHAAKLKYLEFEVSSEMAESYPGWDGPNIWFRKLEKKFRKVTEELNYHLYDY